jgi:deoxyribonuclease V
MMQMWDLAPAQARARQEFLRERLVQSWDHRPVHRVGGADVSIRGDCAHAALVVVGYPELERVALSTATKPLTFPYIPGLLSWRECPALLAAWDGLDVKPDLVLVDGQGIAHPRGFGLAAHFGLLLDIPAVGVAKSHLYGFYAQPGREKGAWAPLYDESDPTQIIGAVLRTRTDVRPVYVSPGHRIDVPHAISLVLSCTPKYRLPEPIRSAHQAAGGTLRSEHS